MKKTITFLLFSATLLSGCVVPIVAGGLIAGAGGVAYYKRNSINNLYTDTQINNRVLAAIHSNPNLAKDTHIVVATKGSNVLLAGQVSFSSQRIEAERAASSVPGINKLYNELQINGTTTQLTHASDGWITTKVKSNLLAAKPSPARNIKVVTENGVVYLLGVVTHTQADMAVSIVRQIGGVQKVVKLFDYTD